MLFLNQIIFSNSFKWLKGSKHVCLRKSTLASFIAKHPWAICTRILQLLVSVYKQTLVLSYDQLIIRYSSKELHAVSFVLANRNIFYLISHNGNVASVWKCHREMYSIWSLRWCCDALDAIKAANPRLWNCLCFSDIQLVRKTFSISFNSVKRNMCSVREWASAGVIQATADPAMTFVLIWYKLWCGFGLFITVTSTVFLFIYYKRTCLMSVSSTQAVSSTAFETDVCLASPNVGITSTSLLFVSQTQSKHLHCVTSRCYDLCNCHHG